MAGRDRGVWRLDIGADEDRLRLTRERLIAALQAGKVGTWHWDRASGEVQWDAAMEAVYCLPEGGFGGRFEDWLASVHPDDREAVADRVEQSLAEGADYHLEHRILLADGSVRHLECRGEVVREESGELLGMVGVSLDVTERRIAMEERERLLEAERGLRQRLSFLAGASEVLARPLEPGAMLRELAQLVVPRIADWCAIDVVEHDDIHRVAVVHRDPDRVDAAVELARRYGTPHAYGSGAVIRTGHPVLVPEIDDAFLRRIAVDASHLELLRRLGLRSAVVVPLRAGGETLGALTLILNSEHRRYNEDDLTMAQDLGRRAGVALANTRWIAEQRRVSLVLQQSMLPPELPVVPCIRTAARYQAAAAGLGIGGDFYDVFENASGTWTALIGDVCGKGPEAAGLTGQVRHTIRTAALRDGHPGRLLGVLNDALARERTSERFCTAMCAELRTEGSSVHALVAGAGHPPGRVLRHDGGLETIASTGLPAGMFADARYEAVEVELGQGDLLFLYTDGVLEARSGTELFGAERLSEVLRSSAAQSADVVVDAVLKAVLDFRDTEHSDDIALLGLSVTP